MIEITCSDTCWIGISRMYRLILKRSIPIAQKYADAGVTGVGHCKIQFIIIVEVTFC
jgi:hypothetical protein